MVYHTGGPAPKSFVDGRIRNTYKYDHLTSVVREDYRIALAVQWRIEAFYLHAPSVRPAIGGLLSSSYRQHQESLAAERERRRVEREERLQRIEREERNKHR